MAYKNELQSNNADLQSILNTINELPSGGASIPIETVDITINVTAIDEAAGELYTTLVDDSGNIINYGNESVILTSGTYNFKIIKGAGLILMATKVGEFDPDLVYTAQIDFNTQGFWACVGSIGDTVSVIHDSTTDTLPYLSVTFQADPDIWG